MVVGAAHAQFPGERFNESVVVGASVALALGAVPEGGSRLGGGLDGGYQVQWYTQRSGRYDGEFLVWAQEHPALNYGPTVHVWWVGGHWHSSLGARFGVAWPLRVGLGRGWWPGPAVTTELGVGISTSGRAGLDVQGAVDATWLHARVGTTLGVAGEPEPRLHLGLLGPIDQPVGWSGVDGDLWKAPE